MPAKLQGKQAEAKEQLEALADRINEKRTALKRALVEDYIAAANIFLDFSTAYPDPEAGAEVVAAWIKKRPRTKDGTGKTMLASLLSYAGKDAKTIDLETVDIDCW